MNVRVFAYGSNLDSRRMRGRVPSARREARARLEGWTLRFNKRGSLDGTGKANVIRTGRIRDVVHGVVYRVLRRDLPALDRAEAGYDRVRPPLIVEGREDDALPRPWLYVARPGTLVEGLRPAAWYLDHVLRGAREHGLPAEHLSSIEAVARGG